MTDHTLTSDRGVAAAKKVATHPVIGPALVLAGAIAVGVGVWIADPTTPGGVIPPCPTNALLHINCPGCGLSRAIYSLIHGDIGAALHFNALAIAGLFLIAAVYIRYVVRTWLGRPPRSLFTHRLVPTGIVTVLVVWFIVRNLPFAPFAALKV
ncbi:MAG: DUF2752 domain-containing protein [Gordonia sp. (in: high G+C Gram-positive bacteria)]|uniref:DUF2752 domain-containing protein n=1 Tax=Gordonia sp. (in: high G+C Gram-positive bacteria) TaxID=84139 RepID=UPI003C731294